MVSICVGALITSLATTRFKAEREDAHAGLLRSRKASLDRAFDLMAVWRVDRAQQERRPVALAMRVDIRKAGAFRFGDRVC